MDKNNAWNIYFYNFTFSEINQLISDIFIAKFDKDQCVDEYLKNK